MFRVFLGDEKLHSLMVIITNQNKDPYETTSMMESKGGLFRGSVDYIAFPFVSTLNGATGFNGGCLFFLL